MWFPVLVAFASAACFALGSALQQRVAGAEPADEESSSGFLVRIARRPSWVVGLVLSAVAFSLHALALSRGDLAVVQPVIVSGIVFAVLIRSGLEHHVPPWRTVVWLVLTWAGLALFLAVRPATSDRALYEDRGLVFVLGGVGFAVVVMLLARRTARGRRRGTLLAAGAGVLFGLVAGTLKMVLTQAQSGVTEIFAHWGIWALAVVGLWAVLLNQRAYQATRLSLTAPVLNVAQVLVAISFGLVVLGENAGMSTRVVVGDSVGLATMIVGIARLASLPDAFGPGSEPAPEPAATKAGIR